MLKQLDYLLKNNEIFSLDREKKKEFFTHYFKNLTNYHYKKCNEYNKICKHLNYKIKNKLPLDKLPFLSVNIFKFLNLKSINNKKIVRVMKSSGTSGNNLSKIYLDKTNSINQIKVLNKLFTDVTKIKERLPMLVIDSKSTLTNKNFSARSAAIIGFSLFASKITYALNEDMTINIKAIKDFYEKNRNKKTMIFGFTHLVWKSLLSKNILKENLKFSNSFLIHGGGWKKLKQKQISNKKFKGELNSKLGIKKIINYYGMVEQTGSIFFESEKCDYFHTSIFSDVFVRDKEFKNIGFNKKGILQILSVLPTSYPGHNIVTEDLGVIVGEDDCKCGKKGKYFKVFDRLEKSEVRGCSDAVDR